MTTLRHLEKLVQEKSYERVIGELLNARPEQSLRAQLELANSVGVAALVLVRLDELNQSHTALAGKMLRIILRSQESDGGWGDPMVTAMCLRALLANGGDGVSIENGIKHLASLQKPEGIWPNVAIRRMPADPFVSAFVLFQLGREMRFRRAIRLSDAIDWFETNESSLDPEARRLWDHASIAIGRGRRRAPVAAHATLWS